jgi:hypothetical protein
MLYYASKSKIILKLLNSFSFSLIANGTQCHLNKLLLLLKKILENLADCLSSMIKKNIFLNF